MQFWFFVNTLYSSMAESSHSLEICLCYFVNMMNHCVARKSYFYKWINCFVVSFFPLGNKTEHSFVYLCFCLLRISTHIMKLLNCGEGGGYNIQILKESGGLRKNMYCWYIAYRQPKLKIVNLLKAVRHRDTALQCPKYHTFPLSWQSYRGNSFRRMPVLDYFFPSFGTNVASVSSQYAWYFPPTIIISWKFTFLAPTHRNPHSPAVFEFPCLQLVSGPDS